MELSCIIINYRTKQLTTQCVNSVLTACHGLKYEIIVVDNCSQDGSVQYLAARFPQVKILETTKNGGFAYANNLGIKYARGNYLLLLNSDTIMREGVPLKMVRFLQANPLVAAVSCKLFDLQGNALPSGHAFASLTSLFIQTFNLKKFLPKSLYKWCARSHLRSAALYTASISSTQAVEVDWVTGACLMVRKEVTSRVGYLNEAYFMYMEDEEWCRRIKAHGWKVCVLPFERVIHLVGQSSIGSLRVLQAKYQSSINYHYYYNRKYYWLIRKLLLLQIYKLYWSANGQLSYQDFHNLKETLHIIERNFTA